MATEALPDRPSLRRARRARLLAAMDDHDLDVLVLGRVANIRYASGVPLLWNAGARPFGPGCVVVRETSDLYLLSTWDEGVPDEIPHDHLFGITWNPMNFVTVLQGIASGIRSSRVGTDAISPIFAKLLPMAFPDAEIVDGGPALRQARRTKTTEEVGALRASIEVADVALAAAVAALRPGVSERELTGVFMDAMASRGITTPLTQDVVRITSPRGDAHGSGDDRVVRNGDLVSFDAGVVADGYTSTVGRTRLVGSEADVTTDGVGDLLQRWSRLWGELLDACQPGSSAHGLLDAYAVAGEPVPATPIARGLGLGFDDPVVTSCLPETAARERLDPGVVLVVTASVTGDAGSIVTHEPVLITPDGPELLSRSPFWQPATAGALT